MILILTSVVAVAGMVFLFASASGSRTSMPPGNGCNFTYSMPAADVTAATQTNSSSPAK